MMAKSSPVADLNSAAVRWLLDPTIEVPTLSWPGGRRAAAMKSASVRWSDVALVASTLAKLLIAETGTKSLTGSYWMLLNSDTLIAVELDSSASVWPSGGEAITAIA